MSDICITINTNGPLKVEGEVSLVDAEGKPIETREGKATFLCRCGASARKPFCDGTHKQIDFDGSLADETQ